MASSLRRGYGGSSHPSSMMAGGGRGMYTLEPYFQASISRV